MVPPAIERLWRRHLGLIDPFNDIEPITEHFVLD
jgi:hypothetical protein